MAGLTVKHAMNTVLVSVSPDHSLREAARRMTERRVGAAVVARSEGRSDGIITERDVLRSVGRGEDVDEECVGDHLAPELVYAHADWPLERAAEKMTSGGFRHVIVVDKAGRAIAILSMRDIVRCWLAAGAHERELPEAPAGPRPRG